MNVSVAILGLSEHGAQVTLGDEGDAFWLPRCHPAVVWSKPPEPGAIVTVSVPAWLAAKHGQLQSLRHQQSLRFHEPIQVDLDPIKAKEPIPMADSNEFRGALFREQTKKSEKSPDMTGHITIGGIRYRLAGWTKEGRDGRKFLSLAAEPPKEQHQQPGATNTYATAHGRPQPQQAERPAFTRALEDEIPFAPEWRG
jgi:hypothetical protein